MSFSGPTAPASPQAELNRRIPADLLRLGAALLAGVALTSLGVLGLLASPSPIWLAILIDPCALLLLPGYLVECLDGNSYAFSHQGVLLTCIAFYFSLALLVLFPRARTTNPELARRSHAFRQTDTL